MLLKGVARLLHHAKRPIVSFDVIVGVLTVFPSQKEDVRQRIGIAKNLSDTLRTMNRDGVLQRTKPGCYRLAGE